MNVVFNVQEETVLEMRSFKMKNKYLTWEESWPEKRKEDEYDQLHPYCQENLLSLRHHYDSIYVYYLFVIHMIIFSAGCINRVNKMKIKSRENAN